MELAAHEIEGLRRSLAIGNGLPSDQIRRLLDSCEAMFARDRSFAVRDERLRAKLTRSGPWSQNYVNASRSSPATSAIVNATIPAHSLRL